MSDPMTNLDADDVLASIRRLVAETHTHAHARGAAQQGEHRVEQAATPSKAMQQTPLTLDHPLTSPVESDETASAPAALVLTPDFRVEKPAPVAVEDETGEEKTGEEETGEDRSFETTEPLVLSMEQAVHVPQDASEQAPEQTSEAVVETLIAEEAQAASEMEAPAAAPADWSADLDDTPDEAAAAHVARLSLEQRIAELEAAVGAQSMEWEPDGSEDLEAEIPRAMPRAFTEPGARVLHFGPVDTSKTVISEADETASGQETDETYDADGAAMTQAEDRANDDMNEIADAEVIEETAYQPAQETSDEALPEEAAEPEETDVADEECADAEMEEEAEPAQGVAPDPDPSLEEELALAGYADEDILDEEALRDLVAQVIREELQGELGQRITRNVRRLVRREVQRALSLREFE